MLPRLCHRANSDRSAPGRSNCVTPPPAQKLPGLPSHHLWPKLPFPLSYRTTAHPSPSQPVPKRVRTSPTPSCPGGKALLFWREPWRPAFAQGLAQTSLLGTPLPAHQAGVPALYSRPQSPPHALSSCVSISEKPECLINLYNLGRDTEPGTSGHSMNTYGV